jgi:hypothetical protein
MGLESVGDVPLRAWRILLIAAAAACTMPAPARAAGTVTWKVPITVSLAAESPEEPAAAIDANGDVAVVWEDRTSGFRTKIELSRKLAGGSFSAPVTITEAPGENISPAVALGPEGQVVVVWTTQADIEYRLRELVMASTGSITEGQFSTPEAISGYEPGNGYMRPGVAITYSGEAFAVWRGLDERIHYAQRPRGGVHFAPPGTLSNPGSPAEGLTLTFSPGGTALAIWGDRGHLLAAVRKPGAEWGAAETIETVGCFDLHAAINDAGAAAIDWGRTKECHSGAEPTWLEAAYRPAGGHFGAAVEAAEMAGWSRAGSVAVSPDGRVVISAKGWMLSPASAGYMTALTRLPGGDYGAPETISKEEFDEEPPVLAFDAEGDLFAAADVRNEFGGIESGVLANLAPAGGTFASESERLQTLHGRYERPPLLAAAGEGQAVAVWSEGYGGPVEVSRVGPAEETPAEGGPAEPTPSSGTNQGGTPSGNPSSGLASGGAQSGNVAGSTSARTFVQHPHLDVTGRAEGARSILVRLIRGRRVVRSYVARPSKGRFRALLSLAGLSPGRYRIEVLRRGGRRHRAEDRQFEMTPGRGSASYTSTQNRSGPTR